jgi:cobalt/nickel transport system ATP-binding protein
MGVIKEESGAVVVDGETVGQDRIKTIRKTFGLLFQNPDDQVFMPTVREDVAFGPVNMGLSDGEIKVCVDEALRVLGIEHLSDRLTHALSGGEKRLVALAGNLAMRPETLLMDEPSSFLDPRSRRRLIDILKTLDQTMLIATHDLDLALDVCSRAIALKDGRVYADGPVERLLTDPALIEACGLEMPLTRQSR